MLRQLSLNIHLKIIKKEKINPKKNPKNKLISKKELNSKIL